MTGLTILIHLQRSDSDNILLTERKYIMKTILCIGDSNTFGYDPSTGFSYPKDRIWAALAQNPERKMINCGTNGLSVPTGNETDHYVSLLRKKSPDAVIIMLGTNDILQGRSAEKTAQRMDRFLSSLAYSKCFLLSPAPLQPGTWVTAEEMIPESGKLKDLYHSLAAKHSIVFADAGEWNPELAFDGVHMTLRGHRTFADNLNVLLSEHSF